MANYKILYNPLSGHDTNEDKVKQELAPFLKDDELEFFDATKIESYAEFLKTLPADAKILIVGGDGTLNRFINGAGEYANSVYYYASGSGNDFWTDLGKKKGDAPVCIDEYLKNLPVVCVNGKEYKFLNGVGFGIDGYCCEVGDKLKAEGKPVNYTSIAVKGLLFKFKPRNAEVTVDGETKSYKKVWIAPTMHGRYYGGGMIPTPAQDRLNGEGKLSVCLMHGSGKLSTLMVFPKIFKGEHVKKVKKVAVLSGNEITVKFAKPCALQIDGETILNVTEYTAKGTK